MMLMALVFVLGLVRAVGHARKGRWWKAAEVFLPVLGVDVVLLGGVERHVTALFWVGALLVAGGFGAEAVSFWRARGGGEPEPSSR